MKNLILTFIFVSLGVAAFAQAYSWQKLTTEKYPSKQDDICFVDANCGWYVNGSAAKNGSASSTVSGRKSKVGKRSGATSSALTSEAKVCVVCRCGL